MAIYTTRWFDCWAQKQGLHHASLCKAVREMAAGLFEADLGGDLFKKRVARPGQGKSGGWRTLVATRKADRWVFVYGFSKNERSNIDKGEEEALKLQAAFLLALTPDDVKTARLAGDLIEVNCDAQDPIQDS